MGNEEMRNDFVDLVRKETDIISLYDRVLEIINNEELREQFLIFQDDHKRHLQILLDILNSAYDESAVIVGRISPEYQQVYAKLNEQKEALQNLIAQEKILHSLYEKTVSWDADSKTGDILDDNLEDEQQHLRFITKVLKD